MGDREINNRVVGLERWSSLKPLSLKSVRDWKYSNRQGGLGIVKVSFLEQAIAVSRGREENASLELDFSSVLTALATAIKCFWQDDAIASGQF